MSVSPSLLVIHGSTRKGRRGMAVTRTVVKHLEETANFELELADLREVDLPLFDEENHPRAGQYEHSHTLEWAKTVGRADAIMVVTAEYNHFLPASIKNAFDYLSAEWQGKPLAIVSYGGASGGSRAAHQLTYMAENLFKMNVIEPKIELVGVNDLFAEDGSLPLTDELSTQLDHQAEAIQQVLASESVYV